MKYLLDTNALFYLANSDDTGRRIMARVNAARKNRCYVSVVSVFEARAALDRRLVAPPNLNRLGAMLQRFAAMSLPETASIHAAAAVADLTKSGFDRKNIDLLDCLIAGHAIARGYTLVTANEKHFRPIRHLTWENWAKA